MARRNLTADDVRELRRLLDVDFDTMEQVAHAAAVTYWSDYRSAGNNYRFTGRIVVSDESFG